MTAAQETAPAGRRFGDALGLSRRVRELMQKRIEARVGVRWDAFDVVRLIPFESFNLFYRDGRARILEGLRDEVAAATRRRAATERRSSRADV